MSHQQHCIHAVMKRIYGGRLLLPALQRRFVWEADQIEALFDSLLRGYPIGSFLFWEVGEHRNDYTFYKFLDHYHERDHCFNDLVGEILVDDVVGVLDGQQRLSAFYLGLHGTHAARKKWGRWQDDSAFPEKRLHVNLLGPRRSAKDRGLDHEFRFLTADEAAVTSADQLWFRAGEVRNWGADADHDAWYESRLEDPRLAADARDAATSGELRKGLKRTLSLLHAKVMKDEVISAFLVENRSLDEILDVFVRVNSAGTVLSRSDLLFSTLAAHWKDGRACLEDVQKRINESGKGFSFDTDFLMRCCLMLSAAPLALKVANFRAANVAKVREEWPAIERAIVDAVELLRQWGFCGATISSTNAVVPLVYACSRVPEPTGTLAAELRLMFVRAIVKQVFTYRTDEVLQDFRTALSPGGVADVKLPSFRFESLLEARLTGDASLALEDADVQGLLEETRGPRAFAVLALIHPHLQFGSIEFHQDHLHPAAKFTTREMTAAGIPPEAQERVLRLRDTVPNLQLLEGRTNVRKQATALQDWLHGKDQGGHPIVPDPIAFASANLFPSGVSLAFGDFEAFHAGRRELMVDRLRAALRVG